MNCVRESQIVQNARLVTRPNAILNAIF
jgi:hypothetical protein